MGDEKFSDLERKRLERLARKRCERPTRLVGGGFERSCREMYARDEDLCPPCLASRTLYLADIHIPRSLP